MRTSLFWLDNDLKTERHSEFVKDVFSGLGDYMSLVSRHLKEVPYGYGERPFVGYLAQTAYVTGKYWILIEYDMNVRDETSGKKRGWYRPDLYLANLRTRKCCTFEFKMDWITRRNAVKEEHMSLIIEKGVNEARKQLHQYSYVCEWRESDYWCSLVIVRVTCRKGDIARWQRNPELYPADLKQIKSVCKRSANSKIYSYRPNFYYNYFINYSDLCNEKFWSNGETPTFGFIGIGRLETYRQIRY